MTQQIIIPFRPRAAQRLLLTKDERFNVYVCHRRFGKTVLAINKGIRKVITCPHQDPRVIYCAPFLKQAREVAWDYLVHYSSAIPGIEIHKGNLTVDYPNGGRFSLAGGDNADSHRGKYADHIIIDEYAQQSPRIWGEIFRPSLSDRLGSADFIGTPKGRSNGFYDVYQKAEHLPNWSRHVLTVNDTHIIPEAELASARLEMSEEEYQQEYMCSWDAAVRGAYWAKEIARIEDNKQIGNVPYEPTLPVHTVCDLGMRDSFAIWFMQFVGREVHFIDYKEYAGMGLPEVIREMQRMPYTYGNHHAPHDIKVRELGTGQARQEVARNLGVNYQLVRNIGVQDGIDAARSFLTRCYFDRVKCQYGIDALRSYHAEYDDIARIDSTHPEHDWCSHGADAFRYAAVTYGAGNTPSLFDQKPDYSRMNRRVS